MVSYENTQLPIMHKSMVIQIPNSNIGKKSRLRKGCADIDSIYFLSNLFHLSNSIYTIR